MNSSSRRFRVGRLRISLALAVLAIGVSGPVRAQIITEFPLPTDDAVPIDIQIGPDGNIWFTEASASKLGRITMAGVVTEFPTPSPPSGVAAGPDGNIWFTEQSVDKVGVMTATGLLLTEFSLNPGSQPEGIVAGPDGNLWITEKGTGGAAAIARLTPLGFFIEYPLTPGSAPKVIVVGPDGNLWFTEFEGNRIGRVTLPGVVTEFPIPSSNSAPVGITVLGNNLWFCETATAKIGKITTAGLITEFSGPTPGSGPRGIAANAPGHDLWFTEEQGNRIGRFDENGCVTLYAVPTPDSAPRLIVLGPDGDAWFTELLGNKIGHITTAVDMLTALGRANVWVGLKNSDDVGTRLDLKAEVFVCGKKVGEGQANSVDASSSGFNGASLRTFSLALSGGPVPFPTGAALAVKVSARISCFGAGHGSGTVRLWFNGQPIDGGPKRDAGSRFDATIGGVTANDFLRNGSALSTTAGSSKLSIDKTVNSAVPCPSRPFTAFSTWSTP